MSLSRSSSMLRHHKPPLSLKHTVTGSLFNYNRLHNKQPSLKHTASMVLADNPLRLYQTSTKNSIR